MARMAKRLWVAVAAVVGDPHLYMLSLSFKDPAIERGFLISRKNKLLSNLRIMGISSLIFTLTMLCLHAFTVSDDHLAEGNPLPLGLTRWRVTLYLWACGAAINVAIIAFTALERCRQGIAPAMLERLVSLGIVCILPLPFFIDGWYQSRAIGIDPLNTNSYTDSRVLLALDCIVTASHLGLCMRWRALWPVQFAVPLSYAVAALAIGSPEGPGAPGNTGYANVFTSCVMLTVLVLFTSFGKRSSEYHERISFLNVIEERTMRYDAQRQLSMAEDMMKHNAVQRESDAISVPTTTETGRLFTDIHVAERILEEMDERSRHLLEGIFDLGAREHWLVAPANLQVLPHKVLGAGNFGMVVTGRLHGSPVAVKISRRSESGANLKQLLNSVNELRVLRQVRHPNLVIFHGAHIAPNSGELALVLELIDGVQLDTFVTRGDGLELPSTPVRIQLMLEVCCALRYLHSQTPRIVHADLKGSNVMVLLLHRGAQAKLTDFGLSSLITMNARSRGGTLLYQAPETIGTPELAPSPAVDVFSLGRLLYVVMTGFKPLVHMDRKTIVRLARQREVPTMAWPQQCPLCDQCAALADQCLAIEPDMRPDIRSVHAELEKWSELCGNSSQVEPQEAQSLEDAVVALRSQDVSLPRGRRDSGDLAPAAEVGPSGGNKADALHLILPELRETPRQTRQLMLMGMVEKWNFPCPPEACCEFHAATLYIRNTLAELHRIQCSRGFRPVGTCQCSACGVLNDQEICDVCDGDGASQVPLVPVLAL